MFVVELAGFWPVPAEGPFAVGLPFTPLPVGLLGLMDRLGPFGMLLGFPGSPVGLFGFRVPGVPGNPADGVVPVPDGAVVAPDEGPAVPGEGPPAPVCAVRGSAAKAKTPPKIAIVFITESRSQFC